MKIEIPELDNLNFNGVINIGANIGQYAKCYYDLGISSVIWIEKDFNLDGKLYQNTKNFGMKQQYYFNEIGKIDINNTKRFKSFWRLNAVDIDIEIYDLLHLDIKNNQLNVLKSFDNLFTNFRSFILTQHHDNTCKEYIEQQGYEVITYSDIGHYLYLKK